MILNGQKDSFLYKIEFHEKDINDETQIIQKTRVRGSYDAHISSCFETEIRIYLCFYAIGDTTLQIAVFMLDSYFNILGQITKKYNIIINMFSINVSMLEVIWGLCFILKWKMKLLLVLLSMIIGLY